MKILGNMLCVLIILVSTLLSGCLGTTQRLPETTNKELVKELLGGWALEQGDYASNVSQDHHFLNVYVNSNQELIIVGSSGGVIDAKDGLNSCTREAAVCYNSSIAEQGVITWLHLINLKDIYNKDEDNGFMTVAWGIRDGELYVYDIKDKSVENAVAEGKLTKAEGSANITSSPAQIAAWLATITAADLKLYAKYKRAALPKDSNELPALKL